MPESYCGVWMFRTISGSQMGLLWALTKRGNNQTNWHTTYFGKFEENMDLSRIYLAVFDIINWLYFFDVTILGRNFVVVLEYFRQQNFFLKLSDIYWLLGKKGDTKAKLEKGLGDAREWTNNFFVLYVPIGQSQFYATSSWLVTYFL